MDNYFNKLNAINLNEVKEQKNKLDYISWAWAWGKVKEQHPDTIATVYENEVLGLPYFTDGKTCMVKVGVTVNGIEHIEWLPIMDYKNTSIPLEKVTSMDINKSIQRALTKAIARHGLGLYVYAGEDLPEDAEEVEKKPASKQQPKAEAPKPTIAEPQKDGFRLPTDKVELVKMLEGLGCDVEKVLIAYKRKDIDDITVEELQQAYFRKSNAIKRGA